MCFDQVGARTPKITWNGLNTASNVVVLFNLFTKFHFKDEDLEMYHPLFPKEIWHDGLVLRKVGKPYSGYTEAEDHPKYHILFKMCVEIAGFMGDHGCVLNAQMTQPVWRLRDDVPSHDRIDLEALEWKVNKEAMPTIDNYTVNPTLSLRQLARKCIKTFLVTPYHQVDSNAKTIPDKGTISTVKYAGLRDEFGDITESPDSIVEEKLLEDTNVKLEFAFWDEPTRQHSVFETTDLTLNPVNYVVDTEIRPGTVALIVFEANRGPLKVFPAYIDDKLFENVYSTIPLRTTAKQDWNATSTGYDSNQFTDAFVHPKARSSHTRDAYHRLFGTNNYVVCNTAQLMPWWICSLNGTLTLPDDWDVSANPDEEAKEMCVHQSCLGPVWCNKHQCNNSNCNRYESLWDANKQCWRRTKDVGGTCGLCGQMFLCGNCKDRNDTINPDDHSLFGDKQVGFYVCPCCRHIFQAYAKELDVSTVLFFNMAKLSSRTKPLQPWVNIPSPKFTISFAELYIIMKFFGGFFVVMSNQKDFNKLCEFLKEWKGNWIDPTTLRERLWKSFVVLELWIKPAFYCHLQTEDELMCVVANTRDL